MSPLRISFIVALAALGASASALTLVFPNLTIPAGAPYTGEPNDPIYTTTATSDMGPLGGSATLSFTLSSGGNTWFNDLKFAITDPSGATEMAVLPNAPDGDGDYTGTVRFATANPGSGTYALSFVNTFGSAFDSELTNLRLDVSPAPVPEPATLAAGTVLLLVRRRRRSRRPV